MSAERSGGSFIGALINATDPEVIGHPITSTAPEVTPRGVTSDLAAFQGAVLVLVAELSYKGPCRKLEVELALRDQALRSFWETWLAHPRIGFPTSERLAELEYLLREPGWLARFADVDQAVRHLRQGIRGRSKPLAALELREEILQADYSPANSLEDADLSATVTALDEPCREYLSRVLEGETWEAVRRDRGDERATLTRRRRRIRKIFRRK